MDIKITGVTFDILRDALAQAKRGAAGHPRPDGARSSTRRAQELSQYAPRILTVQIDPSKIGLLIGKGGETIRGLSEEFESQIDVNDEGQVLVYSANGELGEALAERIRTMTKEVEVGDEFTGKVVKTTTFGAFVELAKGTDGLLHISNVSPGQRVDTVEEVLNKGDEIKVRVVEVDRERGRIGLRLAEDPDIAGKSARSSPPSAAAGGGGGGDRGDARRPRRPRRTAAATAAPRLGPPAPPLGGGRDPERAVGAGGAPHHHPGLGAAGRDGGAWTPSGPSPSGSGSARARPPRTSPRPGSRTSSSTCSSAAPKRYASLEIDQLFDAMGAELNAGTGKETTSVYARVLDVHLERGVRRHGRHGLAAALRRRGARPRAPDRPRGDRDVRGRPAGQGVRRPRRGRLRRPPAGRRDHRPRRRRRRDARAARWPPSTARATCRRNVVVAAAGSIDHDALVALVERRGRRRARRAASPRPRRRRPPRLPPRVRFTARTPSSTTSASAARASRATTSAASRCACSTTSSAARRRRGCSRRCARSAAWRTPSTLPGAVRGHRAGRPLPRHAAGERRHGARRRGRRARALPPGPGHRGRARAAARERQGPHRARRWSRRRRG